MVFPKGGVGWNMLLWNDQGILVHGYSYPKVSRQLNMFSKDGTVIHYCWQTRLCIISRSVRICHASLNLPDRGDQELRTLYDHYGPVLGAAL